MARVQKIFKIRDKSTGKFWNGDFRYSRFADDGKTWKKRAAAENSISYFLRYRAQWNTATAHSQPDQWEIVEAELKEVETGTHDIKDFLNLITLKAEAEKQMRKAPSFMETMHSKGVLKDIEFLLELKPAEGSYYVTMDRIKEARAQLRQLGVKTRSFRESRGVFGMMDRQQALKARLVLDIANSVDLGALRTQLGQ